MVFIILQRLGIEKDMQQRPSRRLAVMFFQDSPAARHENIAVGGKLGRDFSDRIGMPQSNSQRHVV
jgi:hypothetical protein